MCIWLALYSHWNWNKLFFSLSITYKISMCIQGLVGCVCSRRCILGGTKCYLELVEQHGANDGLFCVDSNLSAGIFLYHTHQHQGAGAHQLGCKPTHGHKNTMFWEIMQYYKSPWVAVLQCCLLCILVGTTGHTNKGGFTLQ